MTATITVDNTEYNYYNSFNSTITTGLAGIGVTSGQIVYDASNILISKITEGTGTYADNYLRFERNGTTTYVHSLTMGTGWTSGSEVTGGGAETALFYGNTVTKKHRYIKSTDGTVGIVQILNNSSNIVEGSYGFIKPTNTTQTAADIPLVMGLGTAYGNQLQTGTNYASLNGYLLRYYNFTNSSYVNINANGNLKLHYSGVKKGTKNNGGLGQSHNMMGSTNSSSLTYFGNITYSVGFGLEANIDGSMPIVPNVPITSGGVPIGYNSNLVFCPPNLNPGDNIIITAGSEEYTVISSDGVAIRRI